MSNTTLPTMALNSTTSLLLSALTTPTQTPLDTYPPGYGLPSSEADNKMHEILKRPIAYILLFPFIAVGFGAIIINVLHMRIRSDPEVEAALRRGEEARAGMIEQIKIEEAEGKKERAAARMSEKQAQTVRK